ncbi:hypothetical protein [uncultured Kordia sp.]|uniref:hypothetical protein n=1 Tax=uncultured Kordia sp. TaxID=507699 RepID=UPI00260241D9|nr:hypothetical protein [uncultured Kordia sp.]
MKKKNINSLQLKKESISNLNNLFGGKDPITFEFTCNTVQICAPGDTQIDCAPLPPPTNPPRLSDYSFCLDENGHIHACVPIE